ncbi:recombinase family protein [Arthrobacter sp. StoSoilB5]|jgi:DNA invertase Pin-like site-specific DNA recombinase|nr:recombinase family protein [Arthrobacter sp. StoSoilB5]
MDIGYARVSTAKQDLDRQIEALRSEGIPDKYITSHPDHRKA